MNSGNKGSKRSDIAPFSLDVEVALITGGGTGLGLGMARCLTYAGACVVLVGRREQMLREAVESLGHGAAYRVHDVTALEDNQKLVGEVDATCGPVSILVNNAGIHVKKPAIETTDAEFRTVLDTHVMAAFSLSRHVAQRMIQRGHGSIIMIASMTSFMGMPNVIAYTAAKSAYVGMTRSLAAELSPHGIRVNAIAPGWIDTPMLHKALDGDPERSRKILGRTPLGGFGDLCDIGHAAVYLCSRAARFVTGVVLPVDGGACTAF